MEANIEMRINNDPWDLYQFVETNQIITIGRDDKNDIKISRPNVSRKHASICEDNGKFFFEDYSKFGSQLNGEIIKNKKIQISHGDIVRFDNAELIFKEVKNPEFVIHTINQEEDTSVIKTSNDYYLLDSHQKKISINKDFFTIGSHPKNQLVLDHQEVSSHHCTVHIRDNIAYLESVEGVTTVNGVEINNDPVMLSLDSIIQIGSSKYIFKSLNDPKKNVKFNIVSQNSSMHQIIDNIEMYGSTEEPVLITGNTGTGKELVAYAIHSTSSRKSQPFIAVNCSNLRGDIVDSELFGHSEGAFTGARKKKKGYFQIADGGTLFLDEVGELPEPTQATLLRVLETGKVHPVGSDEDIRVDVRIVAATNRKVHDDDYRNNQFRHDLFFRLNVLGIQLPDLKERKEDIPLLMDHFSSLIKVKYPKLQNKYFSSKAYDEALSYEWPGNIRELYNCCMASLIKAKKDIIEGLDICKISHLSCSESNRIKDKIKKLKPEYHDLINHMIESYKEKGKVNESYISQRMKISRPTIRKYRASLKDYGIDENELIRLSK